MANFGEVYENLKQARELALMGQYDNSAVYYQGFLSQLSKLMRDSSRKPEYKQVVVVVVHIGSCTMHRSAKIQTPPNAVDLL